MFTTPLTSAISCAEACSCPESLRQPSFASHALDLKMLVMSGATSCVPEHTRRGEHPTQRAFSHGAMVDTVQCEVVQ